jgi:uncharacterized repeat protein (TIGR03803 family)
MKNRRRLAEDFPSHAFRSGLLCMLMSVTFFQFVPSAYGQGLSVLHSFSGAPAEGDTPQSPLMQGGDGNFYGTTSSGGKNGLGTVFQITPAGVLNTLASFSGALNGANPAAGLVQLNDGLYGTTQAGCTNNQGNVFRATASGALATLVQFTPPSGGVPGYGTLLWGNDGFFYGTTSTDPYAYYISGSVFRISLAGVITTLWCFTNSGASGAVAMPLAGLSRGTDGSFYGTTVGGGDYGRGMAFKITTNGEFTQIASFNDAKGNTSRHTLTLGNDKNFYGTLSSPDRNDAGSVFMMKPDGTLKTLVTLTGPNGSTPDDALALGNDGNFYGTTRFGGDTGQGTVFRVTPDGDLTTLASFHGTNGAEPVAGLVFDKAGNIYGTTRRGGKNGLGTVFKLTLVSVTVGNILRTVEEGGPIDIIAGEGCGPLIWSDRNGIHIGPAGGPGPGPESGGVNEPIQPFANLSPATRDAVISVLLGGVANEIDDRRVSEQLRTLSVQFAHKGLQNLPKENTEK